MAPAAVGAKANPNSRTSSTTMSQMTGARFAGLPLSAPTQRAIAQVLCYETMTKVQQDAIPPALAGESGYIECFTSACEFLLFK